MAAVEAILDALPVHVNFIDETDTLRYRSEGEYSVFQRRPEAIGRKVQECHSEKSVPLVNRVVGDLKSGKRNVIEFWQDRKGRKIHIRYLPVKDKTGRYIGAIEFAQDITDIQKITGEKKELEEG